MSIRCGDCPAPATHEILPRTRRGPRYVCDQGARVLDADQKRHLTHAEMDSPDLTSWAPGELQEAWGK